jgi:hypothetical protein
MMQFSAQFLRRNFFHIYIQLLIFREEDAPVQTLSLLRHDNGLIRNHPGPEFNLFPWSDGNFVDYRFRPAKE